MKYMTNNGSVMNAVINVTRAINDAVRTPRSDEV